MESMRKRRLGLNLAGIGAVGLVTAVIMSPSGAQAACSSADYTVDGVFDLQGYLACLGAESGGTLPSTGSSVFQLVGIALAFVVIGAATMFAPRRGRTAA